VDQADQGDHNPPWWTRTGFYILLMGGRVKDAHDTGKIKLILRHHRNTSYEFKVGDRIVQLIVENIQTDDNMEIHNLEYRRRGTQGFASTDIGPKRLIMCEELNVKMSFLTQNYRTTHASTKKISTHTLAYERR